MSGIFAALFTEESSPWILEIERMVKRLKSRGNDGLYLLSVGETGYQYLHKNRLYVHSNTGNCVAEYRGLIGCAYNHPVALPVPDAGPFIARAKVNELALAYDGIISGHTGQEVANWLVERNPVRNWAELAVELSGQFSLIAVIRSCPQRIYYATKAKPLYVLYDPLNRGIVVSSAHSSLDGMYHGVRNPRPLELRPYTAGYVTLEGVVFEQRRLERFPGDGTLLLCGGGLDSLVSAYAIAKKYPGQAIRLVYFDYGAKAAQRELAATESIAKSLAENTESHVTVSRFDFPLLGQLAASSLTDERTSVNANPQAGKASEWVPARNTVLMSLALALAETNSIARIATGINQDAATAYPDNDIEWNSRFQELAPYALGTDRRVELVAPIALLSKPEIVKRGEELNIPWSQVASWSCYNGGDIHCGKCSSCRARRRSFELAGVKDPTEYANG